MSQRILGVSIDFEQDVVAVRQRARQIAGLLGFDGQDQVRIATAVSEIARNAFRYAGRGSAEFSVEGRSAPQLLIIRIADKGPGIPHLDSVLGGVYQSQTGMGLGIVGARRLMDHFEISAAPGNGTTVVLKKLLPEGSAVLRPAELARIGESLALHHPDSPIQEIQHQNRELLRALHDLREQQEALVRLNRELEDTNRGVIALYAELDEKAGHLRRADEMKSRFLSNMSHEFRTPLNSIRALARLLLDRVDGPLTGEQEKQVTYVRKAAEDLTQLVDDLLDIAKIESGKVDVQPVDFSVPDLFSALRGMLRPLLVSDTVQLRFDEPDDIPRMLTDEAKVSQILRNFVSNALKFTERGEVRVSATRDADDAVTFAVTDTGVGIAPDDQERIFDEFTQIQGPHQHKVKGTGLGLPLCRKLATLLGGTVTVRSTPGSGSVFTATIPIHYPGAADAATPVTDVTIDETRLRVLVVEDDENAQTVYAKLLRDTTYQVIAARTLRQATDALAHERPSAIILDVVLQGEQTWHWLGQLKSHPATAGVPIMLISTTEDRRKAYALGADAYFVKPIDREQILAQLDAFTQRRILLIDDDAAYRYAVRRMLTLGTQHHVLEAADGTAGVQAARRLQPQVIVLDLGLPDMDGAAVLDALAAHPDTCDIPVVVATSRDLGAGEHATLARQARVVLDKRDWELQMLPRLSAILAEAEPPMPAR